MNLRAANTHAVANLGAIFGGAGVLGAIGAFFKLLSTPTFISELAREMGWQVGTAQAALIAALCAILGAIVLGLLMSRYGRPETIPADPKKCCVDGRSRSNAGAAGAGRLARARREGGKENTLSLWSWVATEFESIAKPEVDKYTAELKADEPNIVALIEAESQKEGGYAAAAAQAFVNRIPGSLVWDLVKNQVATAITNGLNAAVGTVDNNAQAYFDKGYELLVAEETKLGL